MYDPNDDYYEPDAIDQAVSSFREAVHASIKEEVANEMKQLAEDNRALREKLENLEVLEQSARAREAQAERAIGRASLTAREMRLNELVKGLTQTTYSVVGSSERLPKCDQCDKRRIIRFKSPSGREMTELCACAKYLDKVVVLELDVVTADIRGGKILYWRATGVDRDSYIESRTYDNPDGMSLEEVADSYSEYHFLDRDTAQKVADIVNERKKAKAENASNAKHN